MGRTSDSSSSSLEHRTIRWNRNKWNRKRSQTELSNNDFVQLDEHVHSLRHTHKLAVDANDIELGNLDCEIGLPL